MRLKQFLKLKSYLFFKKNNAKLFLSFAFFLFWLFR